MNLKALFLRFAPILMASIFWIVPGGSATAAAATAVKISPAPSAVDRKQQRAAFQAYADAWGLKADGPLLHNLKDSLSIGVTYEDASVHAEGPLGVNAMISSFQRRSPGVALRMDNLLLWADHGLAMWSMLNPKGGEMMHGYDVITYDPADRITSIVGFFDTPGQQAGSPR